MLRRIAGPRRAAPVRRTAALAGRRDRHRLRRGAATSDARRSPRRSAATRALPAAIAAVLTGLFLMMSRRKALSLLIGLLVFENGLVAGGLRA